MTARADVTPGHWPIYRPDPRRGGRLMRAAYYTGTRPFDRAPDTGGRRMRRAGGYYTQRRGVLEMHGDACGFALRIEDAPATHRGVHGYYTDDDGSGTLRPIVARLPGSRGFLAGARADGNAGDWFTLDTGAAYDDEREAHAAAHHVADTLAELERDAAALVDCPTCTKRRGYVPAPEPAHAGFWQDCPTCDGIGSLPRWQVDELTERAA